MLTQNQLDFFHTNGYLIMRGLIGGRELIQLQQQADDVIAQGVAGRGEHHRYHRSKDGKKTYWRSEQMWQRDPIFQAVTVNPDLLENIGQCLGQAFYPWNDSLVVKVAQAGAPVDWHQDPPYGDPARERSYPVPNFTTDIYLDHSGLDNGCLWALPGHHLVGHVDLLQRTTDALFEESGAIPIEMEAGDVLFHAISLPHGSRASTSLQQRRIFYLHYLAEEVFADAYSKDQKTHWGQQKREEIEQMIDARRAQSWELPTERPTLHLTDEGFVFVGTPTTPHAYWGEQSATMPVEQIVAMKQLRTIEKEP
jgi:ectoine hydroxylase-related dioxygenase (phytanoyl-CoA dioxygenase family)